MKYLFIAISLSVGMLLVIFLLHSAMRNSFSGQPNFSNEGKVNTNSIPFPHANDRFKWKTDSPIVVVNYFSLDCPHCRELYVLENKRKPFYENMFSLIYRHSPLPTIQPLSGGKAIIAECVRAQSGDVGFFNLVESIFNSYPESHSDNEWVKSIALSYVQDENEFNTCLDGDGVTVVEKETKEALSHQVYGTPTIVIFQEGVEVLRLDRTNARIVMRIMDTLRQ
jgi:protein-disulfide isomerase